MQVSLQQRLVAFAVLLCLLLGGCGNPDQFKEPIAKFSTASIAMIDAANEINTLRYEARRDRMFYEEADTEDGLKPKSTEAFYFSSSTLNQGPSSANGETLAGTSAASEANGSGSSEKVAIGHHPTASEAKIIEDRHRAYAAVKAFYKVLADAAGADLEGRTKEAFTAIGTELSSLSKNLTGDSKSAELAQTTSDLAGVLFGSLVANRRFQIIDNSITKAEASLKKTSKLIKEQIDQDCRQADADLLDLRGVFLGASARQSLLVAELLKQGEEIKKKVSDVSPPSIVLIDLLRWSHYIGGRDESIISNEGA